jgi:hypothetical protein
MTDAPRTAEAAPLSLEAGVSFAPETPDEFRALGIGVGMGLVAPVLLAVLALAAVRRAFRERRRA